MPTNILSLRNTKFSLEKTVFGFCVITECKIIKPPPPQIPQNNIQEMTSVSSVVPAALKTILK